MRATSAVKGTSSGGGGHGGGGGGGGGTTTGGGGGGGTPTTRDGKRKVDELGVKKDGEGDEEMNGRNEGEVGKDPQGDWEITGAEARAGDKRSPAAEREDEDGSVKGRRRDVE